MDSAKRAAAPRGGSHIGLCVSPVDGARPFHRGLLTHPGGPDEGGGYVGADASGADDARADRVWVREQSFRGPQPGDDPDVPGGAGTAGGAAGADGRATRPVLNETGPKRGALVGAPLRVQRREHVYGQETVPLPGLM